MIDFVFEPAKTLRNYPVKFGWQIVRMLPGLLDNKVGKPEGCPPDIDGPAYFFSLDMTDWAEADMKSVCHYLRGGTTLLCPLAWKAVMPEAL